MKEKKVSKKALITGITDQDGSYLAELLLSMDTYTQLALSTLQENNKKCLLSLNFIDILSHLGQIFLYNDKGFLMIVLNRSSKIFLAITVFLTILTTSNTNAMVSNSKKVASALEIYWLLRNSNESFLKQFPLDIVKFITQISYAMQEEPYYKLQESCGNPKDLLIAIHNFHCELSKSSIASINNTIEVLKKCLQNKNVLLCEIKDYENKTVLHYVCQTLLPKQNEQVYCLDCLRIMIGALMPEKRYLSNEDAWDLISAKDIHNNTAFYYTLSDEEDVSGFSNLLAVKILLLGKGHDDLKRLGNGTDYVFKIKSDHLSASLAKKDKKKKKDNCSIQ